ncbi:MAG: energy transducer TonB [Candidatus Methylomirabilis oxyfera]|nr:energy transducer TonB [Candidatus Methylomirabilis oxyfera]
MVFLRKRTDVEFRPAPASIRRVAVPLLEPPGSPVEFARFLLSSVGLHLLLAWAVMTVGIHRAALPERPLVVRLVEAEAPRASPPAPQPVRPRARQQASADQSSVPREEREIAPRDLNPPSIGRPAATAFRAPEIAKTADQDERRPITPPRAAAELVKELGLPGGAALPSSMPTVNSARSDGPKAVGTPGRIAMIPGASARAGSGPALIGDGLEGARQGSSGADGRGHARRLGAEVTIPIAPTVTVSPRQRGNGRGAREGAARAAGGGFARPDYGANSPPTYPPLAREKGYEGTVYLRALVEGNGRVGNLAIDRSSGHEILDRAAVDSVREWTFLPAQKGGRPVASWVLLPIKFLLK